MIVQKQSSYLMIFIIFLRHIFIILVNKKSPIVTSRDRYTTP